MRGLHETEPRPLASRPVRPRDQVHREWRAASLRQGRPVAWHDRHRHVQILHSRHRDAAGRLSRHGARECARHGARRRRRHRAAPQDPGREDHRDRTARHPAGQRQLQQQQFPADRRRHGEDGRARCDLQPGHSRRRARQPRGSRPPGQLLFRRAPAQRRQGLLFLHRRLHPLRKWRRRAARPARHAQ